MITANKDTGSDRATALNEDRGLTLSQINALFDETLVPPTIDMRTNSGNGDVANKAALTDNATAMMAPHEVASALMAGLNSRLIGLSQGANAPLNAIVEQAFGDRLDAAFEAMSSVGTRQPQNLIFTTPDVLSGRLGAYAPTNDGTVFLSTTLLKDPQALVAIHAEEVGHHIDHLLGLGDGQGDEGEIFARGVIMGRPLNATELAAPLAKRDQGVIMLPDGPVEVEFGFGDTLRSLPGRAGEAFGNARDAVKDAVGNIQQNTGEFINGIRQGAGDAWQRLPAPIRNAVEQVPDTAVDLWTDPGGAIGDAWRGVTTPITTQWREVTNPIQQRETLSTDIANLNDTFASGGNAAAQRSQLAANLAAIARGEVEMTPQVRDFMAQAETALLRTDPSSVALQGKVRQAYDQVAHWESTGQTESDAYRNASRDLNNFLYEAQARNARGDTLVDPNLIKEAGAARDRASQGFSLQDQSLAGLADMAAAVEQDYAAMGPSTREWIGDRETGRQVLKITGANGAVTLVAPDGQGGTIADPIGGASNDDIRKIIRSDDYAEAWALPDPADTQILSFPIGSTQAERNAILQANRENLFSGAGKNDGPVFDAYTAPSAPTAAQRIANGVGRVVETGLDVLEFGGSAATAVVGGAGVVFPEPATSVLGLGAVALGGDRAISSFQNIFRAPENEVTPKASQALAFQFERAGLSPDNAKLAGEIGSGLLLGGAGAAAATNAGGVNLSTAATRALALGEAAEIPASAIEVGATTFAATGNLGASATAGVLTGLTEAAFDGALGTAARGLPGANVGAGGGGARPADLDTSALGQPDVTPDGALQAAAPGWGPGARQRLNDVNQWLWDGRFEEATGISLKDGFHGPEPAPIRELGDVNYLAPTSDVWNAIGNTEAGQQLRDLFREDFPTASAAIDAFYDGARKFLLTSDPELNLTNRELGASLVDSPDGIYFAGRLSLGNTNEVYIPPLTPRPNQTIHYLHTHPTGGGRGASLISAGLSEGDLDFVRTRADEIQMGLLNTNVTHSSVDFGGQITTALIKPGATEISFNVRPAGEGTLSARTWIGNNMVDTRSLLEPDAVAESRIAPASDGLEMSNLDARLSGRPFLERVAWELNNLRSDPMDAAQLSVPVRPNTDGPAVSQANPVTSVYDDGGRIFTPLNEDTTPADLDTSVLGQPDATPGGALRNAAPDRGLGVGQGSNEFSRWDAAFEEATGIPMNDGFQGPVPASTPERGHVDYEAPMQDVVDAINGSELGIKLMNSLDADYATVEEAVDTISGNLRRFQHTSESGLNLSNREMGYIVAETSDGVRALDGQLIVGGTNSISEYDAYNNPIKDAKIVQAVHTHPTGVDPDGAFIQSALSEDDIGALRWLNEQVQTSSPGAIVRSSSLDYGGQHTTGEISPDADTISFSVEAVGEASLSPITWIADKSPISTSSFPSAADYPNRIGSKDDGIELLELEASLAGYSSTWEPIEASEISIPVAEDIEGPNAPRASQPNPPPTDAPTVASVNNDSGRVPDIQPLAKIPNDLVAKLGISEASIPDTPKVTPPPAPDTPQKPVVPGLLGRLLADVNAADATKAQPFDPIEKISLPPVQPQVPNLSDLLANVPGTSAPSIPDQSATVAALNGLGLKLPAAKSATPVLQAPVTQSPPDLDKLLAGVRDPKPASFSLDSLRDP